MRRGAVPGMARRVRTQAPKATAVRPVPGTVWTRAAEAPKGPQPTDFRRLGGQRRSQKTHR